MDIVVLGGGVVGVTSAWYLAKAGHKVTLLERRDGVALETSHANAGQISPGYASPWAAPGIPLKAAKWLLQKHAPFTVRPTSDPFQLRWMLKMFANCTPAAYAVNKGRMVRLAEYSRDCMKLLRDELSIDYEGRQLGTLQLFRSQAQLDASQRDIEVLEEYGVPYQSLDASGCEEVEPALARVRGKVVGGLRLPGDETGDCFRFTQALADEARKLGVSFVFNCAIDEVEIAKGRAVAVRAGEQRFQADAIVCALGSYGTGFLRPLGIELPVYPVKGYSLTLPMTDAEGAPRSTVLDETYKVAITRFDNRIRDYISDGKISTAVNLCRKTDTPIARMIEKGIERIGRPMSDVQTAIENVANLEVSKLENGLPFLATIAGGAPGMAVATSVEMPRKGTPSFVSQATGWPAPTSFRRSSKACGNSAPRVA